MTTNEKINLNYLHQTNYNNTPTNQVGTDADFLSLYPDDTPLRVVPTPAGDIAYVRKFGKQLSVIGCDSIFSATKDINQETKVYALDGTLLLTNQGAGHTPGGTVTAQGVYIVIKANGGDITVDPSLVITFPVRGAITTLFLAEIITDGNSRTYYMSDTGSTYYDPSMRHGGIRHTPVLGDNTLPYFTQAAAYAAVAASHDDGIETLDSENYDEKQVQGKAGISIYSSAGQSPTFTRGVGARVTREISQVHQNLNAVFFNENGVNGAGGGTWQNPYLTIAVARPAAEGKSYNLIYGGNGATVIGGVFNEALNPTQPFIFEPEYGYTPKMFQGISIQNANIDVHGWTIDRRGSTDSCLDIGIGNYPGTISDNTFENSNNSVAGLQVINNNGSTINNNLIINCIGGMWLTAPNSMTVEKNIIKNISGNGININCTSANSISITNNKIFNCLGNGVYLTISVGITYSGTVANNTVYNNGYGIYSEINATATDNGTYKNNIIYSSSLFDLFDTGTGAAAPVITNSNYGTNSGWTAGGTNITTDPQFCKDTSPFQLGISEDSPCYRADLALDNMGANLRIIEIDASDVVINGVKIDAQEQYNNSIYILDTVNHTGTNIKWCNIYDNQGMAVDLYDNNIDLDAIINNNLIHNNGEGLILKYGGNIVSENNFYNNTISGVYSNHTISTFSNNNFYNNKYGLYLGFDSSSLIIVNSIFHNNNINGIYSEVLTNITYCCITDGVSILVDVSSPTNFTNNPLFVNTNVGSENFNIKTTERGDSYNSACKDSASDGGDVGVYAIARTIGSDFWKKHTFTYNPRVVKYLINSKGNKSFNSGTGTQWNWSKGRRRGFDLSWPTGQYTDDTDRLKVEFFNSLYQRADKSRSDDGVIVRFNPLPTQQIDSGTGAITDQTGKTITDSAKSLVEDELRGYHAGVKFDNNTGNGNLNIAKTLTVAGAGWTIDEWIGYSFPYNGYYYFIVSNTSTVLTLSDPNDTIATVSSIDWSIEKYFKILENDDTILTLEDDDSELIDGTYDWVVRFIECHVLSPDMRYGQPRFFFQKNEWKTGFKMYLEEI